MCAAARLLVTADSRPRHLAQAFGTSVVAIAGPTDPRHTAAYESPVHIVRETVPCGPCLRERCPLSGDRHHACMRSVDYEEVARVAARVLR